MDPILGQIFAEQDAGLGAGPVPSLGTAQQPEPVPAEPVARYLTVAGATVDITQTKSPLLDTAEAEFDFQAWLSRCNGCTDSDIHDGHWGSDDNLHSARHWAQTHAGTCRAMPKPTV